MKRAILVPALGEAREVQIPESGEGELDELQRLVGGFIELVPTDTLTVFCNEEGKIQGLPPNYRATSTFGSLLMPGDVIAGDVVVLGNLDDDGDTVSLSDDDVEAVLGIVEVK